MDSGGPKEAWGPDPPCEEAIIRGKDMPNDTLLWAVQKWLNQSTCYWVVDSDGPKEAQVQS